LKKKTIYVLTIVVLFSALLAINPFNFYHHIKAEKAISSLYADPTVRDGAFGTDLEINKIKYLGSNTYRVETCANTFIIEIEKEGSNSNHNI
jgi:hypothetical protein